MPPWAQSSETTSAWFIIPFAWNRSSFIQHIAPVMDTIVHDLSKMYDVVWRSIVTLCRCWKYTPFRRYQTNWQLPSIFEQQEIFTWLFKPALSTVWRNTVRSSSQLFWIHFQQINLRLSCQRVNAPEMQCLINLDLFSSRQSCHFQHLIFQALFW